MKASGEQFKRSLLLSIAKFDGIYKVIVKKTLAYFFCGHGVVLVLVFSVIKFCSSVFFKMLLFSLTNKVRIKGLFH